MSDLPNAMDRRTLLKAGAYGAGGLALARSALNGAPASAQGRDRPNVLWLVSEDNAPYLGCYGNDLVTTPAIDALAAEGVRYDHAVSSAPVCAPSRFSIITGMYATSCGPAHHMRASGNIPPGLRGFPAFLREAGYYCTNNAKTDYNAPIDVQDAWDESSNQAHWRDRPDGAPFFAVFNFAVSHEGHLHPGNSSPLPDGVDPADVELPAYHPDEPQLREDRALYYDQMERLDQQIAQRLAELDADGLAEDTIVFYYADHAGALARSKRFTYDSGLRVPLIVRVPERFRHLLPHAPGSVATEMVNLVDLPPTMLSLAGVGVPDHMQGRAFAGVDRERAPRHTFGFRNRMDERYDMTRTVRDQRYRYMRNYHPHLIYGQHVEYLWRQEGMQVWEREYLAGRLDEAQSAFFETKPVEELYDLTTDPDEVDNLAARPEYRPVVARMRRALEIHMIRTRDNGFIPESSPLEGFDQSSDPTTYPIRQVIRVADVAVERDPANVGQLAQRLGDDVEPIRWWAALGCVMLRERAAGAVYALTDALEDPSDPVRVAAAEALVWIGGAGREQGLQALATLLTDDANERVRLQAANALENVGELARPVLDAIEQANDDPVRYVSNATIHTAAVLKGTYQPASTAAA